MTAYVALLRAVNLAGNSRISKDELMAIGEDCGFGSVRTFIASGNLLFTSALGEAKVEKMVAKRVEQHFGKAVGVFVRTGGELDDVVKANPFADENPSRVMAYFIAEKPERSMLDEARNVAGERMALGPRVLYVAFPEGLGVSKLKLPAASKGTARNMNSVAKMAAILAEME